MTRKTTAAALVAGLGLVLAACGDSSPSERAIEEILEQAAGENADIDLSDGEINIQTEDGELQIDVGDDGNFEMSVDGSTVIDAQVDGDGDGINIQTEDGEANIDVGDDGEGSIEITGEDGESTFDMSAGEGELPDDWPSQVPTPDGVAIDGSTSLASGDDIIYTVTGTADAGWVDGYGAAVEAAGFSETSRFETPESVNLLHQNDEWAVNVFASDDGSGQWDVVISVNTVNL